MDLQSILSSEISETAEEVLIATELLNSQIIYYHPSLPAPQLFFLIISPQSTVPVKLRSAE